MLVALSLQQPLVEVLLQPVLLLLQLLQLLQVARSQLLELSTQLLLRLLTLQRGLRALLFLNTQTHTPD